jgi:hypothetical protein
VLARHLPTHPRLRLSAVSGPFLELAIWQLNPTPILPVVLDRLLFHAVTGGFDDQRRDPCIRRLNA